MSLITPVAQRRYAVFIPSLDGGGAERVTVTLLNELARRGYQVDLVMPELHGVYLADLHPAVNRISLGRSRTLACLFPLASYLRQAKPVALLAVLNHANVVAILAGRLAGGNCRILVAEHNNLVRAIRDDSSLTTRVLTRLMKWLYPKADKVIAVSEGVADSVAEAIALPRSSIEVVYNPVVGDSLLSKVAQDVSHEFFQRQGAKLVAVGRLTEQKDFSNLLSAFASVHTKTGAQLAILGEGPLRPVLEAQRQTLGLNDAVLMPGFVDNPYAWMAKADLFVLSSAWEGLPTVLIEAMACGTRVVSTDCPSGPAEILENGRWGALVPVADAKALSNAILQALADEEQTDVRERALGFDLNTSVNHYLALLNSAG
ncbi:glycosyltransferase [Rheinheimera marina]|uniref:Glycosyltransferase n=1 Tax=Rheinheimera marina TaxID=1774958 RepID=A0ABV9JRL4_9GAMM